MTLLLEKKSEKTEGSRQIEELSRLGAELSKERLVWLSGYFTGQAEANHQLAKLFQKLGNEGGFPGVNEQSNSPIQPESTANNVETKELAILYGSHSGNGLNFSKFAKEMAEKRGYKIRLHNMADYKVRDLKNERNLLIIVSTHGEGVPPFAAEELHEFIHSERAPKLPDLKYAVLALGDKSYFHYCKTGIEFDKRLEELGAVRVSPRTDCDVNYKNDAGHWLSESLQAFDNLYQGKAQNAPTSGAHIPVQQAENETIDEENTYFAEIQKKIKLNGRGSEKETYHIELLIDGSKIKYKPGDAVGVIASNPEELVKKVLESLNFTGNENADTKKGRTSLKVALKNEFELTTINRDLVLKHQQKINSEKLGQIIENQRQFKDFIAQNDVLDLVSKFPAEYTAYEFTNILNPLKSRYYSIASSQKIYEDELHITVEALRIKSRERTKHGCCSTFFADHLNPGDKVAIFIKSNDAFRLPLNASLPVIMVGPGTGVAPFRAFVDERAQSGSIGKNWLIFGHQHFTTDFLYQTEWQAHLKSGALSKLTLAFSRDQEEKVYVQHKILQNSKEIYKWLTDNAYIYVCGDKNNMAESVYNAFVNVVQKEGELSDADARDFMKNLKKRGLYLEDVY